MYRLFRDATRYEDGHHVKDLDCINRDLSKVIVIDWNEKSVKSHQRNALKLKQWKGNDDDRYLIDLALLLKSMISPFHSDWYYYLYSNRHYSNIDWFAYFLVLPWRSI